MPSGIEALSPSTEGEDMVPSCMRVQAASAGFDLANQIEDNA